MASVSLWWTGAALVMHDDAVRSKLSLSTLHQHCSNNMHNALLIYEILGCIIDHLAQNLSEGVHARQRALGALARTCRAFSEPALDALWCRLRGLKPFMHCLLANAPYDDGRTVWQFLHRVYHANSSLSLHLMTKSGVECYATLPACKNSSSTFMMHSL